ncbi:TetR/AcrR family transcriptional regulator [Burkholderia sp. IDO3]|uniref:TetR/AcrR family transcriptional regulator n=1 Tax=Burkholderia sp. IDO3 TaxID=1705310 RepID=UPI0013B39394|nr:TetR/AcrR family transcriptional regulator [Burkholderia sp. IDO3]
MARPREFDEDAVLDAVMDTFWRYGYEATSAQDLVQATGLGRGSLYAAYTNKDGLFEQAMLRYNRRSRENVDLLRGPGPVLDCLRTLLVGVVDDDLNAAGKRGCLATNTAIERASRDAHVAELVRENFRIMRAGIQEAIERGQATGEIDAAGHAEDLAWFVFNAMQGLRVLAKTSTGKDRKRLVAIVDRTLRALG